jgi:hypothetical protein
MMKANLMTAVKQPLEHVRFPTLSRSLDRFAFAFMLLASVVPTCMYGMESYLFRCRLFWGTNL